MGAHDSDAAEVMTSLRRLVRMIRIADRDASAGGYALSSAQLFVLHSLASAPAASLAELARRTLTDQSSVSTVVAKLVAKKLVKRSTSALDRRRAELGLTPAGQRIVAKVPQPLQARIIATVAAMPDKPRKELVRSLERLVEAVGAGAVAPRMFSEEA